jgi:hypothetical protein
MRSGSLTLALMLKHKYIKKGLLELNDVKSFPINLMRLLFVTWGLVFLSCSALTALRIYSYFIE